jgi:hypothetical protein
MIFKGSLKLSYTGSKMIVSSTMYSNNEEQLSGHDFICNKHPSTQASPLIRLANSRAICGSIDGLFCMICMAKPTTGLVLSPLT